MANNRANFTEVLEIQVNTADFDAKLTQMLKSYESWAQKMAKVKVPVGAGALGDGGGKDIANALNNISKAFEDFAKHQDKVMSGVQQTYEEHLNAIRALTLKGGEANAAALEQGAAKEAAAIERGQAKKKKLYELSELEQRRRIAQIQEDSEALKKLTDKEFDHLLRVTAKDQREKTKTAAAKSAEDKEYRTIQVQRERIARLLAKYQADQERQQAQSDERRIAQRTRISQIMARLEEQEAKKVQSVREQTAKAAAKFYDQYLKGTGATAGSGPGGAPKGYVAPGLGVSTADQVERLRNSMKGVTETIGGAQVKSKGFIETLTNNLPGLIGHVIRFGLAWKALNLVLEAIALPFKLFVDGIKDGLTYLTAMQERVADIKEALLVNVVYSKDWATNVELAGKAAEKASVAIVNTAARFGLQAEKVEAAFKSLIQGGGLEYANGNIEKLAEFSAKLLSVTRSAGVSETNQRRVVQETYDLMTGQVKQGNSLLRVLKLTETQWKSIYNAHKDDGTLFDEIDNRISATNERLATAGDRFKDLAHTVDVYRQQLFAAVAEDVWKALIVILQEVKKYYEDHREELLAIGRQVGVLLRQWLDLIAEAGKNNDWIEILKKLVVVMSALNAAVDATVTGFRELKDVILSLGGDDESLKRLEQVLDKYDKRKKERANLPAVDEAYTEEEPYLVDIYLKGAVRRSDVPAPVRPFTATTSAGDLFRRLGGSPQQLPDSTKELFGFPVGYKKNPPPLADRQEALREVTDKLRIEVDKQKAYYDQLRKIAEDAAAARTITETEAANRITKLYERQGVAIDALVRKYTTAAKATGVPAKDYRGFQNTVTQITEGQFNKSQSDSADAYKKGRVQELAVERQHLRDLLGLRTQEYRDEVQIAQQKYSMGLITAQELFNKQVELDKQEHDEKLRLLRDELDKYAVGTTEHEDLIHRINLAQEEYATQQKQRQLEQIALNDRLRQSDAQYQQQLAQLAIERRQLEIDASNVIAGTMRTQDQARRQELELIQMKRRAIDAALAEAVAELEVAKARGVSAEATRNLTIEIERLQNERLKNQIDGLNNQSKRAPNNEALGRNLQSAELQRDIDAASKKFQDAQKALEKFDKSIDKSRSLTSEEAQTRADLSKDEQEAGDALQKLIDIQGESKGSFLGTLADKLFGPEWKILTDQSASAMDRLAAAATVASNALSTIQGVINQYEQGRNQGGVLGGVGSLLSSGPVSDVLSAIPVVGAFVKPLGGILSFIGGLFESAARKAADKIKKNIDQITKSFQQGDTGLADTIQQLEAQRAKAIADLSHKKGGKKYLDEILSTLDPQIKALKKQQEEILSNFEDETRILALHSDDLGKLLKTWQDINKQVKQYLEAGGKKDIAQQFLSLSLEKFRRDILSQINDEEDKAIQDAIKLNDLLKERNDEITEFQKREFELINADAIERRAAGSVSRGQELAQLRKEHEEKLAELDAEIELQQKKLDIEGQYFDLTKDIADLKRRDEELTLLALEQQLEKMKDLKTIVDGIYLDPESGLWKLTQVLAAMLGIDLVGMNALVNGTSASPSGNYTAGPGGRVGVNEDLNVRALAKGGLVDGATRALIGEAGPEAVVPLPDGRSIPVRFDHISMLKALQGASSSSVVIGDINISVAGTTASPAQIANTVANELERRARYGFRN